MRQPERLPEALEPKDVAAFLADLRTFPDRAITLVMLLGGLRAAEVRSLRLADVDMGCAGAGDRVLLREPLAGTTVQTFPGIPGHLSA